MSVRPPPTSTLFPYTTLFRSARTTSDTRPQRGLGSCPRVGAPPFPGGSDDCPTCLPQHHDPVRQRPSPPRACAGVGRSEEHTSELQSRRDLVCRLLLEI